MAGAVRLSWSTGEPDSELQKGKQVSSTNPPQSKVRKDEQDGASGSKRGALDGKLLRLAAVDDEEPRDAHLVRGERARLVGADDVRAAERLDRGQAAHDRVFLGHLLRAEREAGRDDNRESLGDGGDGERDGDLLSASALAPTSMTSVRRTLK